MQFFDSLLQTLADTGSHRYLSAGSPPIINIHGTHDGDLRRNAPSCNGVNSWDVK